MTLDYTITNFEDVFYHEGDNKSVSVAIFSAESKSKSHLLWDINKVLACI